MLSRLGQSQGLALEEAADRGLGRLWTWLLQPPAPLLGTSYGKFPSESGLGCSRDRLQAGRGVHSLQYPARAGGSRSLGR